MKNAMQRPSVKSSSRPPFPRYSMTSQQLHQQQQQLRQRPGAIWSPSRPREDVLPVAFDPQFLNSGRGRGGEGGRGRGGFYDDLAYDAYHYDDGLEAERGRGRERGREEEAGGASSWFPSGEKDEEEEDVPAAIADWLLHADMEAGKRFERDVREVEKREGEVQERREQREVQEGRKGRKGRRGGEEEVEEEEEEEEED